jgi:hypothetical protein
MDLMLRDSLKRFEISLFISKKKSVPRSRDFRFMDDYESSL